MKLAKVLELVHSLTHISRITLITMCIKRPKTFAFDFSNPYCDQVQIYFAVQNRQTSLCPCTIRCNQNTSPALPVGQNRDISDSHGRHGEAVWGGGRGGGTRERVEGTGNKEKEGGRNTSRAQWRGTGLQNKETEELKRYWDGVPRANFLRRAIFLGIPLSPIFKSVIRFVCNDSETSFF